MSKDGAAARSLADVLSGMVYEPDFGQSQSDWEHGDDVTNTDLMDTYMRFPGADAVVGMMVDACWHNGLTEDMSETDMTPERWLEVRRMDEYRRIFGHSVVLYDDELNLDAWHPVASGIGFGYTEFVRGEPSEVEVIYDSAYHSVESERFVNFFHFRTRRGRKGARGRSVLLPIMGTIRMQSELLHEYLHYAKKQGLSYLDIGVEGLSPTQRDEIEDGLEEHEHTKYSVHSGQASVSWVSPQSNAYDPMGIMNFGDYLIARSSHLNLMQLTGTPEGHLSSSQVGTSNWYAKVKEEQDYLITLLRPMLEALGYSDEVRFQDPSEYPVVQQTAAVMNIRRALEGIVPNERIVEFVNRTLGLQGEDQLEAIPQARVDALQSKLLGKWKADRDRYEDEGLNEPPASER